jgi:hypothetical protein
LYGFEVINTLRAKREGMKLAVSTPLMVTAGALSIVMTLVTLLR